VVTAFDTSSASLVWNALLEAGVEEGAINLNVLPSSIEWLNVTDPAPWKGQDFDQLQFLVRANGFQSTTAMADYFAQPTPSFLFQVTAGSFDSVDPPAIPGEKGARW